MPYLLSQSTVAGPLSCSPLYLGGLRKRTILGGLTSVMLLFGSFSILFILVPFSISRPPGSVIKLGGDQSLFFLGGKFQNTQSVSANWKDEPIETLSSHWQLFCQMHKSCQKAFRAKHIFKMRVAAPVVSIFSISATGSTRCSVEVRCASGVQKANCSVHLPIGRLFYKRNWKFKWKFVCVYVCVFLLIIEGDLLFLKYWINTECSQQSVMNPDNT